MAGNDPMALLRRYAYLNNAGGEERDRRGQDSYVAPLSRGVSMMILAFGHVCQNKETAELVRSSPRSPIEERFDVRAVTFGVDSASLINETFAQPTCQEMEMQKGASCYSNAGKLEQRG